MKITRSALAGFGIAALGLSAAVPAGASPQPQEQRGTHSAAVVTSASCHRKASPRSFVEPHSLDAVQFVSGTTGWVAGASRVLATTDGGVHWSVQRSASRADYSEVDAIDGNDAWVVGRHQLIGTTNGGATWRSLPEPCPVISSVHFYSPSAGVAVAGGKLLATRDGGSRWTRLRAPSNVQSVCFTNSHEGWLGANGRIYRTINRGRVWAMMAAGPRPHSRTARDQPLAEVQCAGSDAGWAEIIGPNAAMSQQPHIGYHLSDNGVQPIFAELHFGKRGVDVKRAAPGPYFGAFSSVDPADAVFVDTCSPCGHGTSPMAIATESGQRLARPGRVRGLESAEGAAFTSTSDGWVVGSVTHYRKGTQTQKIVHTTDGGRHWTTQFVQ
ncbi:MAG TPA: YCF48-related protein [Mycobacteriales bacterium]|jgi:photosystem II stability/assembly factor-like uncharacterized protein|nr:YCF48-related protein [Mycobacteriales bacterium]